MKKVALIFLASEEKVGKSLSLCILRVCFAAFVNIGLADLSLEVKVLEKVHYLRMK